MSQLLFNWPILHGHHRSGQVSQRSRLENLCDFQSRNFVSPGGLPAAQSTVSSFLLCFVYYFFILWMYLYLMNTVCSCLNSYQFIDMLFAGVFRFFWSIILYLWPDVHQHLCMDHTTLYKCIIIFIIIFITIATIFATSTREMCVC